jgi:formiminoglutamase
MRYFSLADKPQLQTLTHLRRYETKMGERLQTLIPSAASTAVSASKGYSAAAWKDSLANHAAKYVLFGIPEDIGVKANGGIGGASSAWPAFLDAFVNVQSTDRLSGDDILVLGAFDFNTLSLTIDRNAKSPKEALEAGRHAVANVIDEEVEELVKTVTAAGKLPLVIGGGHNNAYPLLKGASKGWKQAGALDKPGLCAINLDAHADFRIEEGRHSGNPFRYAMNEGFLDRYAVVGLHENYNSQSMMDDLYQNTRIQYTTYEDIFLRGLLSFEQAVQLAVTFTKGTLTGVELDLDVIDQALSSAQSPCGIPVLQARQYLWQSASELRPAYLHVAEGAARTDDGRECRLTGKLISYLVSDFIKARSGT